jgi:two-component system nitrate/nitrite response regulator NarL
MRVFIISNQLLCRDALADVAQAHLTDAQITKLSKVDELAEPLGARDLCLLDLPVATDPRAWLKVVAPKLGDAVKALVAPENELALASAAHAFGFSGLLAKSSEPRLVGAALQLMCAGGEYFPCFADAAAAPSAHQPLVSALSNRQIAVLGLLGSGRTNKEIARELDVSVATVKLDVQAILTLSMARNRTEAVSRLLPLSG